jgi:hypothetical protein
MQISTAILLLPLQKWHFPAHLFLKTLWSAPSSLAERTLNWKLRCLSLVSTHYLSLVTLDYSRPLYNEGIALNLWVSALFPWDKNTWWPSLLDLLLNGLLASTLAVTQPLLLHSGNPLGIQGSEWYYYRVTLNPFWVIRKVHSLGGGRPRSDLAWARAGVCSGAPLPVQLVAAPALKLA